MTDTITLASRTPMAVRLTEPVPEEHRDKPGQAPPLGSIELNGSNHPGAVDGVGYTPGVDAGLFHRWLDAAKRMGSQLADLVWVHEGDVPVRGLPDPADFGHEPGIERMVADQGAPEPTITHEGPVSAEEMHSHSETRLDDSPRAEPGVGGPEPAATEIVERHD